ncbi:MAG TPA: shikimate dehydrogenase [Allosphingosinicella sp.]|nr:shikimate dehydrogenase [Allosphingosinicella sp.]
MGVPYAEVIGDPIAHSKSPLIHNFWLRKLGIEGEYRAVRVSARELSDYFIQRRRDPDWRGCNVTIPHKEMAVTFADRLMYEPKIAGAVNTLARKPDGLIGYNTDMEALRPELAGYAREASLLERPVTIFGAGGAARAVLASLKTEGEDVEVVLFNRSVERGSAVLRELGLRGSSFPLTDPLPSTGLVVNATSLGMRGFPPLPPNLTAVSSPVIDLVYAPVETELVRAARARGHSAVDGLSVLIRQAALAFRHFFGIEAPFDSERELRELLTR